MHRDRSIIILLNDECRPEICSSAIYSHGRTSAGSANRSPNGTNDSANVTRRNHTHYSANDRANTDNDSTTDINKYSSSNNNTDAASNTGDDTMNIDVIFTALISWLSTTAVITIPTWLVIIFVIYVLSHIVEWLKKGHRK
jgi:hypothetical protein